MNIHTLSTQISLPFSQWWCSSTKIIPVSMHETFCSSWQLLIRNYSLLQSTIWSHLSTILYQPKAICNTYKSREWLLCECNFHRMVRMGCFYFTCSMREKTRRTDGISVDMFTTMAILNSKHWYDLHNCQYSFNEFRSGIFYLWVHTHEAR